jgi:hypothetical protein
MLDSNTLLMSAMGGKRTLDQIARSRVGESAQEQFQPDKYQYGCQSKLNYPLIDLVH